MRGHRARWRHCAVLREKRTNKAEAAGLAGADERIAERIAAILAGQGGGNYTASTSGGGNAPSGSWTPAAPGPSPVDVATQGVTGGASFAGLPKADTGILQGGGDFGSAVMTPQEMLIEGAKRRGLDPIDVATAISYETGGKFDPTIKGPTTQDKSGERLAALWAEAVHRWGKSLRCKDRWAKIARSSPFLFFVKSHEERPLSI